MNDVRYCPNCGARAFVMHTQYRKKLDGVGRTRDCQNCSMSFQTIEVDIDKYQRLMDVHDALTQLIKEKHIK